MTTHNPSAKMSKSSRRVRCQTQLIRNCEVTKTTRVTKIITHPAAVETTGSQENDGGGNPYGRPLSRHHILLENIQNAPIGEARKLSDLTKIAQKHVSNKASQKLNFAADRPVYRNLEPINVNDSVLELRCNRGDDDVIRRFRNTFKTARGVEPEPILTDYLTPVDRLEPPCHHVQTNGFASRKTYDSYSSSYLHDMHFENLCEVLNRLECEN